MIQALGLKIAEAARRLGVSRVSLSRVVNGHAALSPELAGVGTARAWLAMQINYDLAALRQQPQPTVCALDTPSHHPKSPA